MEQVSNSSSLAVSDFAARRFILLVDVLRDRGRVTVSQHRKRLGDELGVSLRIECEAFSIWR